MPILFFILATIKTIEEEMDVKKGFSIYFLLFSIYCLVMTYLTIKKGYIYLICNSYLLNLFITIISLIIFKIIIKKYYKTNNYYYLLLPAILCILLTGYNYIDTEKSLFETNKYKEELKTINDDMAKDDSEFYRVLYNNCIDNSNLIHNYSSVESFNSSISPSAFATYAVIGFNRKQMTSVDYHSNDYLSYFSGKYVITCRNNEISNVDFVDSSIATNNYTLLKKGDYYNVYLNNNYKRMGLVFDNVLSYKQVKNSLIKLNLFLNNYITDDKDNIILKQAKIIKSNTKKLIMV